MLKDKKNTAVTTNYHSINGSKENQYNLTKI